MFCFGKKTSVAACVLLGSLAGISSSSALPAGAAIYPSLLVKNDAAHPLIDQLDTAAIVVPWTAPQAKDILMVSTNAHAFGSGTVLFREIGKDERGLPLYDAGTPLPGLKAARMQAIARADGLFDLVSQQTSAHVSDLVQYRNIGTPGKPEFADPVPVLLDGSAPGRSLKQRLITWSIDDIDGDGIPDMLLAVVRKGGQQQPGGSMWTGEIREDSGPGRGYDVQGQWLGDRTTTALMWAKGTRDKDGILSFSNPQDIYYGQKGFRVQWRSFESNRSVRFLNIGGQGYILMAGNIDHLLALPLRWEGQTAIADQAVSVLPDDATVFGTYFIKNITVLEESAGGNVRLMLDGNPGRLVVVEGSLPGGFTELGSLSMTGGALAVDMLATPARFDWDGDGYPDLIVGDSSGFLSYWPGTADPLVYAEPVMVTCDGELVHHQAGMSGSIQGPVEKRWGYLQPTVGDWNGDGTQTIITSDIEGLLTVYNLTQKPGVVTDRRVLSYGGKALPAAWRARPAIVPQQNNYGNYGKPALLHLDWDGDLAVAVPEKTGGTQIAVVEKLRYSDGRPVRLCGPVGLWGRAELSIADWDGDGKWDVLFGTNHACVPYITHKTPKAATVFWLRNEGTNEKPVFRMPEPITLKDGSLINLGVHTASVWPTDLNGDGHLDLIVGAEDGKVYYFLWNDLKWD